MLISRRRLAAPVLATSLVALLAASGCAGSIDPDQPQPLPQPQPQTQAPSKPDTGWVCTLATCGGKCIDNVCYPSNYQPPSNPSTPSNPPPSNPNDPPSTGGCPAPSAVIGSYEGTISGNIKSVIDVQVTGKVNFSVVDDGNGGLKIESGQVFGKALGINFSLPMNGTVTCGKLSGTGTGELVGVSVDGTFTATFAATTKKFDSGSWSGTAPSNGSTGGGNWNAAQL